MKNKLCKRVLRQNPFANAAAQVTRLPSFLPSFLIFAFSALLLSCKKDIPNKHPEVQTPIPLKTSEDVVKVVDGVLSFIDAQTMDQYLKQLMEMP
ncbi:MAG: hypothetical protein LWX09_02450, partial [Bacteroidia bacterium]|nr:hypothetical protein [Bacteroidia bacterium]